MAELQILDISQFNGTVSWPLLEADGAIIRLGYRGYGSSGRLVTDTNFPENVAGAAAAGVPFGCYWVTQAVSTAEAAEEAAYCAGLLAGLDLTFPVYLDSEYANTRHTGRADSLSRADRTACALAWLQAMEAAGYTPGVYASESWFRDNLDTASLTGWSLWAAKYSTSAPSIGAAYDGWQYTDSGTDPACSGAVDRSYFYRDFIAEKEAETMAADYETWKLCMEQYRQELQQKDGSAWSEDDRIWAAESGLFLGGDAGYMWQDFLTREQAAALLHRLEG